MTGEVVSTMFTTTSSESDPPPVSVTVSVIVCEPFASETINVEPEPSEVAPSAHEYELILPVPGVDPVPSSVTDVVAPAHSTVLGDNRSEAAATSSELKLKDTTGIKFLNAIILIGNKHIA
jgi:hypothetical protein